MIGAGLLAPGFVQIISAQEQPANTDPALRNVPLDRPPLLVPRDYSAGFVPELLDLEELFSTNGQNLTDAQLARLLSFPRSHGDQIVLDDSDPEVRGIAFRDALMAAALVDALFALDPLHPLSNPLPRGNDVRPDDFPGSGVGQTLKKPPTATDEPLPVIPEPGTGVLLAGGLVALGLARSPRNGRAIR
jgi:hypothetical protein